MTFAYSQSCRYEEAIEAMKETVTNFIDTLIQEDFHEAFQKLLERYKCIAAVGDYFEWSSYIILKFFLHTILSNANIHKL